MNWRKNPASSWKLYCIIDNKVIKHRSPQAVAQVLFRAGVDVVQLRYKNCPSYKLLPVAKKLQRLANIYKKTLLINDRVDVAGASGSGGVHLGSGDLPLRTAHLLLGPKIIIGKTVHKLKDAKKTRSENVDYVGAGPVFRTPLKKNLKSCGAAFIRKVKKELSVPVFAIGGINRKNLKDVLKSGPDGVSLTRALFQAKDILSEIKNVTD